MKTQDMMSKNMAPARYFARHSLMSIAVTLGLFAGAGCDAEEARGDKEPDREAPQSLYEESFLDFHVCGKGAPDWTEHATTFAWSPVGERLHEIQATYRQNGSGPEMANMSAYVSSKGTEEWHNMDPGQQIIQLSDGESHTWSPPSDETRDFREMELLINSGHNPPDGEFVEAPQYRGAVNVFSGNVEVGGDRIATQTFETEMDGGVIQWQVRFLPMYRVAPADEDGDENEWCVTHLSPEDGDVYSEEVLCAEWGSHCSEQHECIAEGMCDDCTPGPTGLCPEHLADTIAQHGGSDMQEHADDIVAHIHHGKEPGEDWEGKDSNFHEFQGDPPQDGGGDACHEAKVELGAELTLDTAAFLSDLFFIGTSGYFNDDMKVATRQIARGMIAEDGSPVVEYINTVHNEADEATRLENGAKVVFGLLGANGFTHVIIEGIKTRYNGGHSWRDKWHIVSDTLVGLSTVASFLDPATVGIWVVRIATLVRSFADAANLGVDLERNINAYIENCN